MHQDPTVPAAPPAASSVVLLAPRPGALPVSLKAVALAVAAALCMPLAACAQTGATTAQPIAQTPPAVQTQPAADRPDPGNAAAGQAQRARLLPTTAAQPDLPNRELTSQIMFQVLAAEIALQRGQVAPAYQTYLALARDTQDPRMAQRASEIAIGAQSIPDALTAARLWHQYAPSDPQAAQLDASLLVLNGYLDEARPLLARQLAAVPDAQRGDAILSLQLLIARGSDRIGGIHALRELLQDDMQRPESYTAIGRQQIVANDAPGARASFLAALKLKPDYEPAALMLAQMGGDERRQAITIVADYTAQHPDERNPRFLLAQLYLADNQLEPARQQFEAMRKMNPKDPAPLLALGLIAMQNKQEREAERYFVAYADVADQQPDAQRVDAGPAYLYLAQMAADRKELATADHWLGKVDRGSNQYVAAQIARAQLQTSQKQYDQASATLAAIQPRNAREAVGVGRAEAAVLMQAGHYPQAEQKLGALLELVPDNPDVLYDYAMAAERNGHYDLMENELRRLIVIDPNNAQAYNALGYSLADRNQHLDEADKLVQKALALAPDDAYIMDSAGWVKYRMGDKDAAVDLLRRAYQAQPNAEIGAHLGTVLWSQGKQDEARQALHAAQQLDPTDETLIRTLDQLKLNPTP